MDEARFIDGVELHLTWEANTGTLSVLMPEYISGLSGKEKRNNFWYKESQRLEKNEEKRLKTVEATAEETAKKAAKLKQQNQMKLVESFSNRLF